MCANHLMHVYRFKTCLILEKIVLYLIYNAYNKLQYDIRFKVLRVVLWY